MTRFNPFKHSVHFVGHMKTVHNAASDQALHCLLNEYPLKIGIKL